MATGISATSSPTARHGTPCSSIRHTRPKRWSSAHEQDLTVTHIINTHGHADHINGNERAVALTRALVAAHPDVPTRVDIRLGGGDSLAVGAFRLQFLHTPGPRAPASRR